MKPVHECSAEELIAEARRRDENRRLGRPLDYVAPDARTPEQLEADDARLEKEHEDNADKQLRALGFEVVRFSHPGRTKQTPGIADRRYYHRGRRLAFWWEAKSATGTQRPEQRNFQELVTDAGDLYVLGTDQDLFAWLIERGVAARGADGLLIPLPFTARTA